MFPWFYHIHKGFSQLARFHSVFSWFSHRVCWVWRDFPLNIPWYPVKYHHNISPMTLSQRALKSNNLESRNPIHSPSSVKLRNILPWLVPCDEHPNACWALVPWWPVRWFLVILITLVTLVTRAPSPGSEFIRFIHHMVPQFVSHTTRVYGFSSKIPIVHA